MLQPRCWSGELRRPGANLPLFLRPREKILTLSRQARMDVGGGTGRCAVGLFSQFTQTEGCSRKRPPGVHLLMHSGVPPPLERPEGGAPGGRGAGGGVLRTEHTHPGAPYRPGWLEGGLTFLGHRSARSARLLLRGRPLTGGGRCLVKLQTHQQRQTRSNKKNVPNISHASLSSLRVSLQVNREECEESRRPDSSST